MRLPIFYENPLYNGAILCYNGFGVSRRWFAIPKKRGGNALNARRTFILKKNQRGMMGYVALIAAFILIAVALNGGLGQSVNRRIEYPELLTAIREDNVKAVAIRGTSLVGLYRNGTVADADFPERGYDFETTIGSDFYRHRAPDDRDRAGKIPGRGQRERSAFYRGIPRARGLRRGIWSFCPLS